MKRKICAVMLALFISVVVDTSPASAQSQLIRVKVPFEFSANNETLPAGTYHADQLGNNLRTWRIRRAGQRSGLNLLAGFVSGAADPGIVRLTFRRYGDRYFLVGFRTSSYQITLPKSDSEKDFARSKTDLAKSEAVTIELKGSSREQ